MGVLFCLAAVSPAAAARRRAKKRPAQAAAAQASPAAAPAPRQSPPSPVDERTPKEKERPNIALDREPEATTVATLTGRGAPDIAKDDTPVWSRVEPPPEQAAPDPSAIDEAAARASARARTASLIAASFLVAIGLAWLPEIMRAAEDGPPPAAPGK
jgi:hypothetical protein